MQSRSEGHKRAIMQGWLWSMTMRLACNDALKAP
jgi:hypothetical protein